MEGLLGWELGADRFAGALSEPCESRAKPEPPPRPRGCQCQSLCVTPWIVARQAPLSMGFSRQEYGSGLPCPSPEPLTMGINAVPLDGREGRGLLEGLQDQAGPGTGTHWHLQGEEYSSHPGKGVNTRGKKKVSMCSCFILLPISPPSKPFLMLQPHARRPEVPWTTILCHLDSHACIKMSLQALRTSGFHSNFPLTLPGAGIR